MRYVPAGSRRLRHFLFLLLACIWPAAGQLRAAQHGAFSYETMPDGQSVIITHVNPSLSVVVFPETINGLPVAHLLNRFIFANPFAIASVTFPSHLTTLPNSILANCPGLTNVTIRGQVTHLPISAFHNCPSLQRVTLPDSVASIGAGAFLGCRSLTSIELPAGLREIEWRAFRDCEGLTAITLPPGLRQVGYEAFSHCLALTNLVIAEGVTNIGDRAFEQCVSLMSLRLPDSLTTLGINAFRDCRKLQSLRLGKGLTRLPTRAFAFCQSLTYVTIPASVRVLDDLVFDGVWDRAGLPPGAGLYFAGDAPQAGEQALVHAPENSGPMIFRLPGTRGWGAVFAGRPTRLWDPRVAFDGPFGVRQGRMEFTVTGRSGLAVVVEGATDAGDPVWSALDTLVLTNGRAEFTDPHPAGGPVRLYRFRSP